MALSDRVAVLHEGILQQYAPAREVYERPANKFVADFMGLVNFLSGTVTEPSAIPSAAGRVSVSKDIVLLVMLRGGLGLGAHVVVTVRPEDVQLSRERPVDQQNVLRGVVVDAVFLGLLNDYRVEVTDLVLRAVTPRHQTFGRGESVYVRLDPEHCLGMV